MVWYAMEGWEGERGSKWELEGLYCGLWQGCRGEWVARAPPLRSEEQRNRGSSHVGWCGYWDGGEAGYSERVVGGGVLGSCGCSEMLVLSTSMNVSGWGVERTLTVWFLNRMEAYI